MAARELTPAKRAVLERLRNGATPLEQRPPVRYAHRPDGAVPYASAGQRQLWLHSQFAPNPLLYNEPVTIHRDGPFDLHVMERVLAEIVRRHEVWRTGIAMVNGQLVQHIQEPYTVTLPFSDLSQMPPAQQEAEAERLATADARRPFDLTCAPLWRCLVLRMAPDHHRLYFTFHHIIFDGHALYGLFAHEVAALYAAFVQGLPSPLSPLPVQYADYAWWEAQQQSEAAIAEGLAFWRTELPQPLPVLALPSDRSLPQTRSNDGAAHKVELGRDLSNALREFARRESVTLYTVLLSSLFAVLHRYSGQDAFPIGSVYAKRNEPGLNLLLGYFLRTIVVYGDFTGDPTVRELLQQLWRKSLIAVRHDGVPFDRMVQTFQPVREPGQSPMFNVSFTLEPPQAPPPEDWAITQMDVTTGSAKFDLYLELDGRAEEISGRFSYATDLFTPQRVAQIAKHWQTLLINMLAHPEQRVSQLGMLTPVELQQQLHEWVATERPYPPALIHELVEQQARRTPDGIALRDAGSTFTYSQLAQRVDQLARHLAQRGAGPGTLVAVCLDRSASVVIALLALLKAGSAYLPLDITYPAARLAYMLADAHPALVLTQAALVDKVPPTAAPKVLLEAVLRDLDRAVPELPHAPSNPLSPAYITYTSGSTGQPKGVVVPHRGVANLLQYAAQEFGCGPGARVLQGVPLGFDVSLFEMFYTLSTGAELTVPAEDLTHNPNAMVAHMQRGAVTDLHTSPALLGLLIAEPGYARCSTLQRVFVGGEALPADLMQRHLRMFPDTALINCYGPTEASVWTSFWRCDAGDVASVAPLGTPVANTQLYVLDRHQQPVPVGVAGELCIGGDGLAIGYLRRPELTAERFVPNAWSADPAARLYRTGDLACFRSAGMVDFLGRIDTQVKIRGHRVETGEVEHVLLGHPDVREAVVVARQDVPGDEKLVAYLIARNGRRPPTDELRRFAAHTLPDFMLPNAVVWLTAYPLTPSKKVDRKLLPAPQTSRPELATGYLAPRTPTERALAKIWATVLDRERVGVRDNFFDLGGHSLLAARAFMEMGQRLGVTLPPSVLFSAPTIAALAEVVEHQATEAATSTIVPVQPNGYRQPLFIIPGAGTHHLYLRHLVRHLGNDQPVYALFRTLLDKSGVRLSVEQLAGEYLRDIQRVQPHGPYLLAGHSFGGTVAYELAQQFYEQGEQVGMLAMFDVDAPGGHDWLPWSRLAALPRRLAMSLKLLPYIGVRDLPEYVRTRHVIAQERVTERVHRHQAHWFDYLWQRIFGRGLGWDITNAAETDAARDLWLRYVPRPYPGSLDLFWPSTSPVPLHILDSRSGWPRLVKGGLHVHAVPGDHVMLLLNPLVSYVATELTATMQRAMETTS